MSVLWKMAAHWKGAPGGCQLRVKSQKISFFSVLEPTVNRLARRAVTVLCRQRLVPAQLELDLAAVAAALVLDVEPAAVVVDRVRRPRLPAVLALRVRVLVRGLVGGVRVALDVRAGVRPVMVLVVVVAGAVGAGG